MAKTMRKNTNAGIRGGASCSSDEGFVMKLERREALSCQRTPPTSGDERCEFEQTLQHSEARDMGGLSAGQNQLGAAGIDDETIADFERNLPKNLYKLWNRMSSGSYFPPPVKAVEIPKASGVYAGWECRRSATVSHKL